MSEEIKLKKKTPIAIYLIIFFSFAYTVTIGTNWHSEPGTLADSGIYEEYGESLGLTYKSKNHREFAEKLQKLRIATNIDSDVTA